MKFSFRRSMNKKKRLKKRSMTSTLKLKILEVSISSKRSIKRSRPSKIGL